MPCPNAGMEEGRIGSIGHGPEFFIGLSEGMALHLRGGFFRKEEVLYVQKILESNLTTGFSYVSIQMLPMTPIIGALRGCIHPSADNCHIYFKEHSPENWNGAASLRENDRPDAPFVIISDAEDIRCKHSADA